jgi:DNA-binding response OmpR family regulator
VSLAIGYLGPFRRLRIERTALLLSAPVASDATPVILVVDDDPVIVRLLEINLSLEGFAIFTATNGGDAVRLAQEKRPALVLLDLMMPGMDGWTVREALLEDPATARIPVVVLSARTQDEDRERGYALDVAAYITKPFDPAEMVETVRRHVARPPTP